MEISLLDVMHFLSGAAKKLLIAAIVGAIVGLSGWLLLGKYTAELKLNNNGGIDLVAWRNLQKTLPNLAAQMVDGNTVPADQINIYRQMSEESWWKENLNPVYSINKNDLKEMVGQVGSDVTANNQILNFVVKASGDSQESALANIMCASNFIKGGASYITLQNWLTSLQMEMLGSDAEVQKKISATKIELQYQDHRLSTLESLLKRFPADAKLAQQVVDPKDSGAKYMPLSTQIVALNTDIANNKEALERLNDRMLQILVLKDFLQQALPLLKTQFDGIVLNDQLLDIEAAMRAKVDSQDLKGANYLNNLRVTLLANQAQFTIGLMQNSEPTVKKAGLLKFLFGGLLAGFLLMLLALGGQRVWVGIKGAAA